MLSRMFNGLGKWVSSRLDKIFILCKDVNKPEAAKVLGLSKKKANLVK